MRLDQVSAATSGLYPIIIPLPKLTHHPLLQVNHSPGGAAPNSPGGAVPISPGGAAPNSPTEITTPSSGRRKKRRKKKRSSVAGTTIDNPHHQQRPLPPLVDPTADGLDERGDGHVFDRALPARPLPPISAKNSGHHVTFPFVPPELGVD